MLGGIQALIKPTFALKLLYICGDLSREFMLRGRDIIKLVQIGHTHATTEEAKQRMPLLPNLVSLDGMFIRPLILCGERDG